MTGMEFLWSIIASIVAGLILVWATAIASARARWVLTATLGRLLDLDVEYVFPSPSAAAEDIAKELARAARVDILTGRGNELQRKTFEALWDRKRPTRKTRILLPELGSVPPQIDWVARREREIATFDSAFGNGLLATQIRATSKFLEQHLASENVSLRSYNHPHIGRIIITERFAYFTPYQRSAHGRDSRVFKYRRGDMYDCLVRLFSELWEVAPAIERASVPAVAE